jgi:hypothetical protein
VDAQVRATENLAGPRPRCRAPKDVFQDVQFVRGGARHVTEGILLIVIVEVGIYYQIGQADHSNPRQLQQ